MKEEFKEMFKQIKEVFTILGQVLYEIRDAVCIIVLGIAGISVCSDEIQQLGIYLIIVILVFACAWLRIVHSAFIKLVNQSNKGKRFTFLDSEGNPTILIEDIPEIVDYLYRLEESQNESITK